GSDPVKAGLVSSLSRPGGNVTGVTNLGRSLDGKRIEILHDVMPAAAKIGYLINPDLADTQVLVKGVRVAADRIGRKIHVANARNEAEIDAAFNEFTRNGVKALVVATESLFITQRAQIVTLAGRKALVGCYPTREFAATGGLMSYGPDVN